MPKVYLTTLMRRHTDGRATVDVPGATVSDVFAGLVAAYPSMAAQLRDADGRLFSHVNVFVNGDNIRDLDGERTALDERDEVQVIPAMAGG